MNSHINLQYITNEQGNKIAVQVPFKEWNNLLKDYTHLKQMFFLKKEIKQGLTDLKAIEMGNSKEITLSAFLDEN